MGYLRLWECNGSWASFKPSEEFSITRNKESKWQETGNVAQDWETSKGTGGKGHNCHKRRIWSKRELITISSWKQWKYRTRRGARARWARSHYRRQARRDGGRNHYCSMTCFEIELEIWSSHPDIDDQDVWVNRNGKQAGGIDRGKLIARIHPSRRAYQVRLRWRLRLDA